MSDLTTVLTQARATRLEKAGINSLFELLTTFPRKLQYIKPLDPYARQFESGTQYFFTGHLARVEQRKSRKAFLILHFRGGFDFSGYYFASGRYIYSQLKTNSIYQVLATKQNNFWSIKSLSIVKEQADSNHFILGKAKRQNYLLPIYPKIGKLTSSYLRTTHRSIPKSLYIINLQGLIPQSPLIPQNIDLYHLHHPQSVRDFSRVKQHWLSLKVFLKLALIKYISIDQQKSVTTAGKLDTRFLKQLEDSLPYSLSPTQKKVVKDILHDICYE